MAPLSASSMKFSVLGWLRLAWTAARYSVVRVRALLMIPARVLATKSFSTFSRFFISASNARRSSVSTAGPKVGCSVGSDALRNTPYNE